MRYANLKDHASTSINFGDYLQFIVIASLYKKMEIPDSDIYYISGEEIESYHGESLLLPLNFISTIFIRNNKLAISKDIIPVFLGLSLSNMKEKLDVKQFFEREENVSFFMRYAPIGCRDAYTFDIFKQYHIPAYLNGCLTATLPLRKISQTPKKVIFADAPSDLLPYVPSKLFENCEFVTQQACFSEDEIADYRKIFDFIRKRYEYYQKEAALVVTSRLHVAVPCTAMGIPVIFAKDYIDARFSWMEKLLPVYSLENYDQINWTPSCIQYEEMKREIISLAISRIQSVFNQYEKMNFISSFYLLRPFQRRYFDSHDITHKNTERLKRFMQTYWQPTLPIRFALWGITKNAPFWIQFIQSRYPQAEFSMAIDSYKNGEFYGLSIQTPEALIQDPHCYVIVIAVSAVQDAMLLFQKTERTESQYCIAVDSFITEIPPKNVEKGDGC